MERVPDNYMANYITGPKHVTIPNNIKEIGDSAFYNCKNLESIDIPNSVTFIGDSAFEECNHLSDIYYEGTEEEWDSIKGNLFKEDLYNTKIHFNS